MTQPPSSPPEHPEQPQFRPTNPEQTAAQPQHPAPPYPQAAQQPPQYPGTPQQPQHEAPTHTPPYPGATEPPPYPGPAQPPTYPAQAHQPQHTGLTEPPPYPGSAAPPPYPGTTQSPIPTGATQPPPYPGPAQPSTHLSATEPPSYPDPRHAGFTEPPAYPGSAAPPPYPGAAQPSTYPGTAEPPSYPGPAHQPQHTALTEPPPYPGSATPPPYPGTAQSPTHPGATPNQPQPPTYPGTATNQPPTYPGTAQNPPQHPGATSTQPPPYPRQATAQPIPPQYAPPQQPPTTHAPPNPGFTPPTTASGAPAGPEHPHHISTDRQRVHISAHQRRTDATAVGNLLLYLPNFLCSLLVVSMFSLFFGDLAFLVIIAWILSGALVFHRPTESALARRLLHLRYPTPQERAKLEPVWREVTARAGVEGRNYELWVEDSDGLNAVAAAGHIVGVTRFAMNELPNGELAAVMAHELGHHVGGHAWSGLLGYWYAQPGRLAWRFLRAFSVFVFKVSRAFSCFGVGFVVLVLGGIAMATISTLYGLPLLILGVPYALAAVGRRAELRADEHAAALGFAPMLASVLDKLHQEEQRQTAALAALNNGVAPQESPLSKLLSSHPDHHTRLHHLQPYLQQQQR
jgi:Zn-dependent protease with chaperone function